MPTLASFRTFVTRGTSEDVSWRRSVSALDMPQRFGQDARMVSFLAHEHAFRLRHNGVGGDHLLLALLDDHRAVGILENANVDVAAVRRAVAPRMVPATHRTASNSILPRTSVLQKAWNDALAIAERQGAEFVEPQHLLLALAAPANGQRSKTAEDLIAAGFTGA